MGKGALKTLLHPEVLEYEVLDLVVLSCDSIEPIAGPLLGRTGIHSGHLPLLFLVVGFNYLTTAHRGSIGWQWSIALVTLVADVTLLSTGITSYFPKIPSSHSFHHLGQRPSSWSIEGGSRVHQVWMITGQYFFCIGEAYPGPIGGGVHCIRMVSKMIEVAKGEPTSSSPCSKWGGMCRCAAPVLVDSSVHVDVLLLSAHHSPFPFFVVPGHVKLIHFLI